jgi:hypothetical protein
VSATIIAPAFRTGVALAAAQLEGAANDGRPMDRGRHLYSADLPDICFVVSRALPARTIASALDGACRAQRTGEGVIAYAWESLAAPLSTTETHDTSLAARLAVATITATLRACGVDVIG